VQYWFWDSSFLFLKVAAVPIMDNIQVVAANAFDEGRM
jgi:hypothetical protein